MKEKNFKEWFANFEEEKREFWTYNEKNKVFNIEDVVENLHANVFQFIFELIQNADDTVATEASFYFYEKKIIFSHNGKNFTRKNIQSITSVGYSDKKDNDEQIGKFGLGFKSVNNITKVPEIYSFIEREELNFKISNYIIPEQIEKVDLFVKKQSRNKKTFFVFNLRKDLPKNFTSKCNELIKTNGFRYLLFLNNLKKISVNIFKNKIEFKKKSSEKNKIAISQSFNKKKNIKNFFSYRHKILDKKNPNAYIIFAYPVGDKNHFYRTPYATKLHIFLETQENTGLNFYLHAPFIPNNSRTEIDLFKEKNKKILSECSAAFIKSIEELKKLKILNLSFVSILPHSPQSENEKFSELHQTIQDTLKNKEIWECKNNQYRKANQVIYWGNKSNNIFSDYDLKEITEGNKTNWLKQVNLKESSILLKHFNNNNIIYELATFLSLFTQNKSRKLINDFLFKKSLKWLYDLYKLFSDLDKSYTNYSYLFIIKTNNNEFKSGNEVKFFNEKFINLKSYSTVNNKFFDKKIFSSRKINFFKKFFKNCGVTEINKEDEIKDILIQNFHQHKDFNLNAYVNVLNYLLKFYKKTNNYNIFENYPIFINDKQNLRNARDLFLDEKKYYPTYLEYLPIDLLNKDKMFVPKQIEDRESYISLAKDLDIMTLIPLSYRYRVFRYHHHPYYKKIIESYGESVWFDLTGRKYIDDESTIPSLNKLIDLINETKEKKLSYIIVERLKRTNKDERQARFRPRANVKITKIPSSFMIDLKEDYEWIPQKDGSFSNSQDSSFSSTDKIFLKIAGVKKKSDIQNIDWLKELDFSRVNSSALERKEQISFANKNKILPELLDLIIGKSPEEQKKIISSYQTQIDEDKKTNKKSKHPSQGGKEEDRTEDTLNENKTGQDNNESGKKLALTKETDTKLKRIKNTLKEKHYLTHCQICCLSDIASSNESENLLVKKLGKINRKKLMDVHHIHSKERGGDVYNMGNMLVLCSKHHLTFAKQLGYSKKTLKDLVIKLVNNKEIVTIQLPREDGSLESVEGYKITTNKDLFEVFFTKPHSAQMIKNNQS